MLACARTHMSKETEMNIRSGILLLSLSILLGTGCKSDEEKAAEEAAESMAEAGKQMGEAGRKMAEAAKSGGAGMDDAMAAMGAMGAAMGSTDGKKVETVDFRQLKDLLPESLPGMTRTDATGEKTGAMGMQISTAEGRYKSNGPGSMSVTMTDIGSMSGLAGMANYAWSATEYDRESGTGYEKTTTFNGHKAQEKYDRSGRFGELSVMVGGRFVVKAEGRDVDMNAIKAALGKVDLAKLDGMKNSGVQ